ncbi:fumarate hydratase [Platysternon megacephalum]|uniref:Fumarate hydratase n=1 Tax=Platysternon megacephalum TaxID=55544 RepID=A0A4D9DF10_9SAUR|nr:fumarate hydratase [Platysternon megacephalum]
MEASRRDVVILSLMQTGTLMMGYLRARSEASAAASARRGWAFLQALERRLKEAEEEDEEEEEEEEAGNESPEEARATVPILTVKAFEGLQSHRDESLRALCCVYALPGSYQVSA